MTIPGRFLRRWLAALLLLMLATGPLPAAAQTAPRVAGTWNMTLLSHQVGLELIQDGAAVTGTLMMMGKDVKVEGTFADGVLALTGVGAKLADRDGGQAMEITLWGRLTPDDTLEGEIDTARGPASGPPSASASDPRPPAAPRRAARARSHGGAAAARRHDTGAGPGRGGGAATADLPRTGPRRGGVLGLRRALHLWAPAAVGPTLDLSPTALRALAPYRDALTIVSNTDVRMADPTTAREIGGDHFRSSAVFLTQARPKRTTGPDVEVGPSLDQLYARRFGQDTPIPSLQLCVEPVDTAGGCQYGYSCHYMDALSWSTPTTPLPMIRDPRVVFDQLFNVLGGGTSPAEQRRRRGRDRSILDWVLASTARLAADLGPGDRRRLDDYLNSVREVERRIQRVEAVNLAGDVRDLPGAPAGVPDSFVEHVRLMFDLQVVALRAGITRVVAFKLAATARTASIPTAACAAGSTAPRTTPTARRRTWNSPLNAYHVSLVAYLLDLLARADDGGASLLTVRSSSTDRRWATPTCTTTARCRSCWPATPAAASAAAVTCAPPTGRRWPT